MALVTIANNGCVFDAADGEIVLDAALAQGIALPHQCRGGSCGTCKARVVEGAVDHGWSFGLGIDDAEKAAGFCLLCQSRALTPTLTVETLNAIPGRDEAAIAVREIETTIVALHDESPRVRRLILKPDDDAAFDYVAGSYAEVLLPGVAVNRMYSFATAARANDAGLLDFYVALHPGGAASGFIHDALAVGDALRIKGPFGTCRLPVGDGPLLCVAGGTGLAPILAILDQAFIDTPELDASLLFSVRRNEDVFALERLHALAARNRRFRFALTVTDEAPKPAIAAHGRLVTQLLPSLYPDLSSHRIVMGGAPAMIDACLAVVATLGADLARTAYDKFTPAAALSAPVRPTIGIAA